MEGHIVSLTNTPTFSNVRSGLNQCRREGMGKGKGQPGGNVCRDVQGKDSLIGIRREGTGRCRAGDMLWADKNGEENLIILHRLLLSRVSKRISELQTSLVVWEMVIKLTKQTSHSHWSLNLKEQ